MAYRPARDSEPPEEVGWWLASDGKWYPPESSAPQQGGTPAAPQASTAQWGGPTQQAGAWGSTQTQTPPPGWTPAQPPSAGWTPPKRKRGKGVWIALGAALVLLIIIIAIAAGSSSDKNSTTKITSPGAPSTGGGARSIDNSSHAAAKDIDGITDCGADEFSAHAAGTLTNHSSDRSNYIIQVAFIRPDGSQAGTGAAFANDVDAGQKADWKAVGGSVTGQFTCKVTTVTRFASP